LFAVLLSIKVPVLHTSYSSCVCWNKWRGIHWERSKNTTVILQVPVNLLQEANSLRREPGSALVQAKNSYKEYLQVSTEWFFYWTVVTLPPINRRVLLHVLPILSFLLVAPGLREAKTMCLGKHAFSYFASVAWNELSWDISDKVSIILAVLQGCTYYRYMEIFLCIKKKEEENNQCEYCPECCRKRNLGFGDALCLNRSAASTSARGYPSLSRR
jgi:hypothetical protein